MNDKIILLLLPFVLISCRDKLNISEPEVVSPNYTELMRGHTMTLIESDIKVTVNENGEVYQPIRSSEYNGWSGQIYKSGLWMAGYQGTSLRVNAAGVNQNDITSNYVPVISSTEGEVYYFNQAILELHIAHWPLQAPKDINDVYRVYGDEMCWINLGTVRQIETEMYRKPFNNIRVSQSIYSNHESDHENVVFIRYEIFNNSDRDITDLYLGYYNDTDINYNSPGDDLVGYDLQWQISYIYSSERDPITSQYYGIGTVILQTPDASGVMVRATAHRVISRDGYSEYGEFNLTPDGAYYALKGLDNYGVPMRDPETGEETKFAFPGNPVTSEGWIDSRRDARNLLSVGPYTIPTEQKSEFVVALFIENGNDLSTLLNSLRIKASRIILNPDIWN